MHRPTTATPWGTACSPRQQTRPGGPMPNWYGTSGGSWRSAKRTAEGIVQRQAGCGLQGHVMPPLCAAACRVGQPAPADGRDLARVDDALLLTPLMAAASCRSARYWRRWQGCRPVVWSTASAPGSLCWPDSSQWRPNGLSSLPPEHHRLRGGDQCRDQRLCPVRGRQQTRRSWGVIPLTREA